MRGDCWGTWLIMLGFMDLRWPRVCRRSTPVLFVIMVMPWHFFMQNNACHPWRSKLHWYTIILQLDLRQSWVSLIFSCDQAALWMVFSVRLSVCPSVCPSVRLSVCLSVRLSVCPSVTPFWPCSHHRIIMKFSGVITLDQGKVHAKGQGQRSKVKVTEVTTQIFVSGL